MPNKKPANRKAKRDVRSYASYDISQMKRAVHAVCMNNQSHKKAAHNFGVPRSSLIRYLHKIESGEGNCSVERVIGRPSVLSMEQENDLSATIENMEARLFGLSLLEVRKLVYSFCKKNKITNTFSPKSEMAGRAWMTGFRNRHPELSLRKPEAVSAQRASGFNRVRVERFYDVLEASVFSPDGSRIITEENIFNVDESGYTVVQKPHKV